MSDLLFKYSTIKLINLIYGIEKYKIGGEIGTYEIIKIILFKIILDKKMLYK